MVGVVWWPGTLRAADPYVRWWTLTTPHFRVHYHSGLESVAQRAASIAERAHQVLVPQLGWQPSEVTDVVITDQTDSANGMASGLPYNTIVLYVSAPDDMSVLGDYDDWQVELITHEYTHILHIDNLSGLPALVNAIFGRVLTPNQAQPRWLLEGLAVAMESEHTTAGRLRGTQFDMYLRADVLEKNLATLDELNHGPRRWPGGNLWYLYGSKFIEWIQDTYGPDTFAAVATHYGRFVIPWGINRAIRRVTGQGYPALYASWKQDIERQYAAQARAIRERGLREGVRLTQGGRAAFYPRFVPPHCQSAAAPELVYYRDDGHTPPGLYRITADPARAEQSARLLTRAHGSNSSIGEDCSIVFESSAPSRRRHFLNDLFRLPSIEAGESGERARLTVGARARDPDVSADGRSVVYVTNDKGTSTLRIADVNSQGLIGNERRLVASARFEQAFTPRFSPDGRQVAYSVWTQGGYRDIRVVEVSSGRFEQVTHDRAMDQQPTWAPDGKALYFTSDRTGVANIYVHDRVTGKLAQVTNVLTGAYMPEVSRDASTLVYVGYTSQGFDLFSLPLERGQFLEALPASARDAADPSVTPTSWPVSAYNPLPTLRPYSYRIEYEAGSFGNALTLRTSGADAVGQHAYAAAVTLETGAPAWRASLDYSYNRLPFGMHMSLFTQTVPRTDYRVGDVTETVNERLVGFTTGVSLGLPGEFESQGVGFSYTVADTGHSAPLGTRVDPWGLVPTEPSSGLMASVHLGYGYSNAEGTLYGISLERGFSLALGIDVADPALGSESTLASFAGSLTGYFAMPWHRHHVLALAVSGGSSGGTYPRRGLFGAGGFADQPVLDVYTSGLRQSGYVLRGYAPSQFLGTEYTLLNGEYRFPIAYVDRGIGTLPVFLQDVSGTLFADWGGAYFDIDPRKPLDALRLGVGAELWMNVVLGYRVGGTLRLGVAKGLDDEAPAGLQTYFVAASGF